MEPPWITYQLWIRLDQPTEAAIGRLGECAFPAGWYVYTGSARNNLPSRVGRHCRSAGEKRLRWHIDYFLAAPGTRILYLSFSGAAECAVNAEVGGRVLCPGLGASDCRARCGSHLRYLGPEARIEDLAPTPDCPKPLAGGDPTR